MAHTWVHTYTDIPHLHKTTKLGTTPPLPSSQHLCGGLDTASCCPSWATPQQMGGGLSSRVDQSPRHSQLSVFAPPIGFGRTKDLSGWCSHGTHSNFGCGMLPVLQQEVSEASVAATGDTVWEVVRTENHCEAPHPGTLQERGSQRGWRTPGDKAH